MKIFLAVESTYLLYFYSSVANSVKKDHEVFRGLPAIQAVELIRVFRIIIKKTYIIIMYIYCFTLIIKKYLRLFFYYGKN